MNVGALMALRIHLTMQAGYSWGDPDLGVPTDPLTHGRACPQYGTVLGESSGPHM